MFRASKYELSYGVRALFACSTLKYKTSFLAPSDANVDIENTPSTIFSEKLIKLHETRFAATSSKKSKFTQQHH
jgi:hypothetical protein